MNYNPQHTCLECRHSFFYLDATDKSTFIERYEDHLDGDVPYNNSHCRKYTEVYCPQCYTFITNTLLPTPIARYRIQETSNNKVIYEIDQDYVHFSLYLAFTASNKDYHIGKQLKCGESFSYSVIGEGYGYPIWGRKRVDTVTIFKLIEVYN